MPLVVCCLFLLNLNYSFTLQTFPVLIEDLPIIGFKGEFCIILCVFFQNGFSCVISMHDGVVMYTTPSLTATLGFPKDMWIGRSFIDFIHIKDRNTFASQITKGLAVPTSVNSSQEKVHSRSGSMSTMVCRIRRYRGLTSGFGVKERKVTYMLFLLKLTFKKVSDEIGDVIYLVVQATALFSAFKEPKELIVNAKPFIMQHSPDGKLEYIDPESVQYLGYLPQEIIGKDVLQLYHQNDLAYLTQVYETIIQKGGITKSNPYRMMTQNGDYIKLETEWTSFINPWSRKLEFVIGKHHILEGPTNPDVFQTPEAEKMPKVTEEEKKKQEGMRNNMIKIMNEVLTKPAKLAKQQMSKRCQEIASLMEILMEEPKADAELRVKINDQDKNYFERDSMLGGISPHHDCNDSKSSTETPPSYNQLNYNDTLQRYFESRQPLSFEDYNNLSEEYKLSLKNPKLHNSSPNCLSPLTQNFGELGDLTSSCESVPVVGDISSASLSDHQQTRLTEMLLNKHNADMEKELLRVHRETRSSKGEREKIITDNRQKKKEHLARCNGTFQQPIAVEPAKNKSTTPQLHGVKRTSKLMEVDNVAHKHHCPTSRQPHRRPTITTNTAEAQVSATVTTSMAASNWYKNQVSSTNTFLLGVGIPQQIPIIDPAIPQPMVAIPGIPVQCLMYGQAVYGAPIIYSALGPQISYPVQQPMMSQSMQQTTPIYSHINNPQPGTLGTKTTPKQQTTEGVSVPAPSGNTKSSAANAKATDEVVDRTDGESSYSSLYSSFFKTESGSAEESYPKKCNNKAKPEATTACQKTSPCESTTYVYDSNNPQKTPPRRKLKPAWMEQVCVTSELIYKYQIMTKSMDEVLQSDKQKISELAQLYLDLQLEGVAARLTLEEAVTSSSSSGEETQISAQNKAHAIFILLILESRGVQVVDKTVYLISRQLPALCR
ncbi:unnamed protein product [Diatraea saccharalis]|uniref:Period circadian protein n=1 Tax=Diatraea saccharalis TaxID=40085 RepID=A0A9P0FX70_9NEOP|nr:unnamed protein product [Diatraea saccharalis]